MFSSDQQTLKGNEVLEWNNPVARIANIGLQVEVDTFLVFEKQCFIHNKFHVQLNTLSIWASSSHRKSGI